MNDSDLDDEWKRVVRDAVIACIGGKSEEEWMKEVGVTPTEAEYLRNVGVWPWRRDS